MKGMAAAAEALAAKGMGGKGFGQAAHAVELDGTWHCPHCGFVNRPQNDVCGGAGPMGCKAPGPAGAAPPPMMMQREGKGCFAVCTPVQKGKGMDGKGAKGPEWKCGECGFMNKSSNTQCGGAGPLGCNAPKPSDWVCPSCGFVNKPHNTVCGGEKGKLGCKEPRPSEE